MIRPIDGYPQKDHSTQTKRYCQVLDLKDDPDLILAYRKAHSKEKMWQEILDGIRSVGILEMEIYLSGHHLVMIVDTPIDFNWQEAMSKLSQLPRQAEWEAHVSQFQHCDENSSSDEKWTLAERIFHLYHQN